MWDVGKTWELCPCSEHTNHIAWLCFSLCRLFSRQVHILRLLLQMQILVQVGVFSPLVPEGPTLTLGSHPMDILCSLLAAHQCFCWQIGRAPLGVQAELALQLPVLLL
jgi:hypothetical protein